MAYMIKIHVLAIIFLLFIRTLQCIPEDKRMYAPQGKAGVRDPQPQLIDVKYTGGSKGRSGTKPNDTKKTKK